jgi:hypothetical protein
MPVVYIDLTESISFPHRCPHCGAPPEQIREIAARGGLAALLFDYVPPTLLAVPVCRASVRRRKVASVMMNVAFVAYVVGAGYLTILLARSRHPIAALPAGMSVAAAVLIGRTGKDEEWMDETLLGLSVHHVPGPGTSVRLTFRRDAYFSEWAAMNPGASMIGAVASRPRVERVEPIVVDPLVHSRVIPAIVLVVVTAIVALHHWYASSGGKPFISGLSFLTAIGALALGGVVYPPLFWSFGKHGMRLPKTTKIVSGLLAAAGLAAGFVLGISYRR